MSIARRSSARWSASATTMVTTSNLLTVREDGHLMGWKERRWPVGEDLGRRRRLMGGDPEEQRRG